MSSLDAGVRCIVPKDDANKEEADIDDSLVGHRSADVVLDNEEDDWEDIED